MKTLYVFECLTMDGDVFVDKDGKVVGGYHNNDANYRSEYMSFIPKFFGGRIKSINFDLPEETEAWDLETVKEKLQEQEHSDRLALAIAAA